MSSGSNRVAYHSTMPVPNQNSAYGTTNQPWGSAAHNPASFPQFQASAPPTDKMDSIAGYEDISFCAVPSAPPGYFEATHQLPPDRRPPIENVNTLTEEEIRDIVIDFANRSCCYGVKPAKKMRIVGIEPECAYHYVLETYTESRETAWVTEPFTDQLIDGPMNGPAPSPWEIQIKPKFSPFQDGHMCLEVPHTASVKTCHSCVGLGRKPCHHCMSMGKVKCRSCQGEGQHHDIHHHPREHCNNCSGNGWSQCSHCQGLGQTTCKTCMGNAKIKCYIKLTITFKNHKREFVIDRSRNSNLPEDCVINSDGRMIFKEDGPRVWPMPAFPNQAVLEGSRQLVQEHSTAFPNELIHAQRHQVRMIPVTQVHSIYNHKEATFYVYGFDNKVYFPDYYHNCCGCCFCSIL